MTRLLIPDGEKEHRNEVFFCLPIYTDLWMELRKHHLNKAQNGGEYVRLRRPDDGRSVIMVFQGRTFDDEQAIETCAWIRTEGHTQDTIYIVPHDRTTASITSIINRSVGIHRDRVLSLDSYMDVPLEAQP